MSRTTTFFHRIMMFPRLPGITLVSVLIGSTSIATLHAQMPQRRELPAPAITAPAEAQTAIVPTTTSSTSQHEIILFSDEGAGPILDFLERLTDRIILRPQNLPQIRVSFDSRGPISREDAILAIESLLVLNGVMVTELGGRFLKAVPAANVNQQVPELITGRARDLAPSQRIYAKIFRIGFLQSATQAVPIVQPLLSSNSAIINLEKSNALLITDALVNLQRVETLLEEADRPQPLRGELEFVRLRHVGAEEVQRRLDALIAGPLRTYFEGNTFINADERTNQLIIFSPRPNFELLQKLISSIDVDAAPITQSEVFYMRQAQAEAVVTLIESIISRQQAQQQAQQQRSVQANRAQSGTAPAPANGGNEAETAEVPPELEPLVTAITESSPSLQFSSFVGLAADVRTNSIVAYGTRSDIRTITSLIEKIDIPLPQVRIEAIITEVTLSDNDAFGLERFGFTYNPAGAADLTFGGPLAVSNSGGGLSGAGFDLGGSLRPFTLQGIIESAQSLSDVRVLSTPSIVVSHNETGRINVSERRPFIVGTQSDLSGGTATRSQIDFRDIGIQLEVTPLIGADGTIQLVVDQNVDSLVDTTIIDGNEQPIVGVREANSTISVQDRDIIILGGLQENRRSVVDNRWPVVGRIPVIGRVFGGEREEHRRIELIIFLRPTIMENPAKASSVARDRLDLSSERFPIERFLETGTLGNTYLEGTRIELKVDPENNPAAATESD